MAVPRCAWGRSRRTPVPTPHSEGQPPRLATPAVGPLRHLALQLRFFPLLAICVTMVQRSWMTGGSVEATLELWAASLRTVKERIRPLFRQDRTAAAAGLFLDALLGPERRKTGWMRAEAAGDP